MINHAFSIAKKVVRFHHEHGLKALFIKIKMQLGIQFKKWVDQKIRKEKTPHQMLEKAFPAIEPIAFIKVKENNPRLNLVLDDLKNDHFYSETAISIIMAVLSANLAKMPLRIISRAKENTPYQFFNFIDLYKLPRPAKVEFFSDYDRAIRKAKARLQVGSQEIFLAASWQTAEAIECLGLASNFYLIQQTALKSGGEDEIRLKKVLNNPAVCLISGSSLLAQATVFYKPAFPEFLYAPSQRAFESKSRFKLFFYARPDRSENLFLTGLQWLDEAFIRGILNINEWDVYFAGAKTPSIKFSNGLKPKSLGKMRWEDYLEFIKTVDLGFSLLAAPYPNMTALDIAASGGVALTNSIQEGMLNMISAPLEKEEMMQGFQKAINLVKNVQLREQNYGLSQIERSWEKSLSDALHLIGSS